MNDDLVNDTISRQAAISEIMEDIKDRSLHDDPATPEDYAEGYDEGIRNAAAIVLQMPSAQPGCEDAVSRKAVAGIYTALWEIIGTIMDRNEWDDVCHTTANELLSVTPKQPGWIPCSERLPKPNEYENDVRVYYLVQNEYGDMMVCSWHGSYWTRIYRNAKVKDKVVAWQPLPTPYREGGQDSDVQRDT